MIPWHLQRGLYDGWIVGVRNSGGKGQWGLVWVSGQHLQRGLDHRLWVVGCGGWCRLAVRVRQRG